MLHGLEAIWSAMQALQFYWGNINPAVCVRCVVSVFKPLSCLKLYRVARGKKERRYLLSYALIVRILRVFHFISFLITQNCFDRRQTQTWFDIEKCHSNCNGSSAAWRCTCTRVCMELSACGLHWTWIHSWCWVDQVIHLITDVSNFNLPRGFIVVIVTILQF